VLKKIFEHKREEMQEDWRRLHNEELRNLYASPNIIQVIKSSRMRWAWHVARIEAVGNAYTSLVREP
jgi:hypothetical protein